MMVSPVVEDLSSMKSAGMKIEFCILVPINVTFSLLVPFTSSARNTTLVEY